jgi:hypothetical protein
MGLGDALMDSGAARVAQLRDPRKVRILLGQKLVWSEVWDNNPRLARKDERGDFQVLYGRDPVTNMRGYHTGKTDQRWTYNLNFRPEVGELYFTDAERAFAERFAGRVIIEPRIKSGASPNKQWGNERWDALALLCRKAGIHLTQMGGVGTRPMSNAELIQTPSFRLACAVLARAKAFVSGEGGLHHAAAAVGVPGVVIFGGFTPVELTGYAIHRNLGVSLGDACGMRVPCAHCKLEMEKITPEQVFGELKGILNGG